MYLLGSLRAYDVMGDVIIVGRVHSGSVEEAESGTDLFQHVVQVRGTGEDDPREWLKDALVAFIEGM